MGKTPVTVAHCAMSEVSGLKPYGRDQALLIFERQPGLISGWDLDCGVWNQQAGHKVAVLALASLSCSSEITRNSS